MSKQELYSQRRARIDAAVACSHMDRIPLMPTSRAYPYVRKGHTMGQAMNDLTLTQQDMKDWILAIQPDMAVSYTSAFAGAGQAMEEMGFSLIEWPGRAGGALGENGVTQIMEMLTMDEDVYDQPSTVLSLLPRFNFALPKAKAYRDSAQQFEKELADEGFPTAYCAIAAAPYDILGLFLRGTLNLMTDIHMYEDEVLEVLEHLLPTVVSFALTQAKESQGRFVYIPLKNGMEGYLSLEQYESFYLPTLSKLCHQLVSHGLTPLVACEGPYTSRLELLRALPERNCVIRLDNADMVKAKAILGKDHCLSGGFYAYDLIHSNPHAISEYLKFLLDTMGRDGGYIFDFGDRLDAAREENLEAMLTTLSDYGSYK